jgi:hypothetical protein
MGTRPPFDLPRAFGGPHLSGSWIRPGAAVTARLPRGLLLCHVKVGISVFERVVNAGGAVGIWVG